MKYQRRNQNYYDSDGILRPIHSVSPTVILPKEERFDSLKLKSKATRLKPLTIEAESRVIGLYDLPNSDWVENNYKKILKKVNKTYKSNMPIIRPRYDVTMVRRTSAWSRDGFGVILDDVVAASEHTWRWQVFLRANNLLAPSPRWGPTSSDA